MDIREQSPEGTYSFNLGYIESDSNSTLYLMAIRDENGLVSGIQKMSKEMQNDLYGINDKASSSKPYNHGLEDEINDNLSEIYGSEGDVVFDATTNLKDPFITATDKFDSMDIPKTVADWILTCQGSNEVNVKRTIEGGKIAAWIYYDSENRMAWSMNTDGTTLKFTLTDFAPQSVSGATLIYYQAPEAYQDLEVIYKNEKLIINMQ